jgi:hypothetical protein
MEDQPLLVFALLRDAPPLHVLRDALRAAGHPVEFGVGTAGQATEAELESPHWEAAFARWIEPEMHEVWLIERMARGEDEEAEEAIARGLRLAASFSDAAGQLIVSDHLRRTQAVYLLELLPALFDDEDHPAWTALDVVLRTLAQHTDGLIYAETEGFYDADGEMILAETDAEDADDTEPAEV